MNAALRSAALAGLLLAAPAPLPAQDEQPRRDNARKSKRRGKRKQG